VAERRPAVYSIAAGTPFVDALAAGLAQRHGGDPLALSRVTVLLPTRRACRALHEAFLRIGGGAPLLLPAIRPLGDVDEDELVLAAATPGEGFVLPPAMPPLRRLLLLTRLILQGPVANGDAGMAARLAAALADLLDSVATEGLSLDALDGLVPAEHAAHWQVTLEFLAILRRAWPALLAEEGLLDPGARRVRLIEALAARWRDAPPADPVYVAGSTGSIPATAGLMRLVAHLAQGAVVLPGLDIELDDESWQAVAHDPTHPQYGLNQLLARIAVDRAEVDPWPAPGVAGAPARSRLLGEALRPAATTDAWRRRAPLPDEAFSGLCRIECEDAQAEAVAVALLLREALDVPGRSAALVTPDRHLARRVAAELGRWGVEVDDSAGLPLGQTPPGVLLRLAAWMIAERAAPVPLLAALKHPLVAAGQDRGRHLALLRRLERRLLRGPRPAPGFAGLETALAHDERERGGPLPRWIRAIAAAAQPFAALLARERVAVADLVAAHVRFAEWLASSPGDATGSALWAGDAGEVLHSFVGELVEAAPALGAIDGSGWPGLLEALLAGVAVRPRFGRHPRAFIWGPLEARLQQADLVVLGGLNEGTWPPEPEEDPWMSRPMRQRFGLPPPERRIGLAAHDFVQAAAAPAVALTRAKKVEGAPTVPSRWLLRLDAMLAGDPRWAAAAGAERQDWPRLLDAPAVAVAAPAPEPRPPLAARPRRLSVTQVETWIRDPYAIFARHILRLEPLEPIDADPGALDRGRVVHEALDAFVRGFPAALPADAEARLIAAGERTFGRLLDRPAVRTFWWPRFLRVARWFVEFERARRAGGLRPLATEIKGELVLAGPGGDFRLIAKADRIDRDAAGALAILDYKTSKPPSPDQVASGLAPQLPLEAAIALAGGFPGITAATVGELAYIRLKGGEPAGELSRIEPERDGAVLSATDLAARAQAGLARLIADYDAESTPYLSQPRPQWLRYAGDYDHLARVREWRASLGDGE
jgi:ATP-dependent helicase/nuclease subunit B